MLLSIERAAELFPLAVVLGQLKRALHVKAAAKLQKRGFDVAVVNFDGFVFDDAVMGEDAPPQAEKLRYNTSMDCNG